MQALFVELCFSHLLCCSRRFKLTCNSLFVSQSPVYLVTVRGFHLALSGGSRHLIKKRPIQIHTGMMLTPVFKVRVKPGTVGSHVLIDDSLRSFS
jgi:hypothetical protein